MLDDRKLDVLRAIVEDFVATHEPVGSKALVDRHRLGVSSATIRNDMAVLEEEGLITQPHTSAGRIPTDAGYRMFVDRLTAVKPLSSAERRAIETFLDGAVDLDDVVHRTVRLLAQVTRQVAVVQYPSLTRSVVKHVEIVSVSTTRVVVVVIADSGTVEQRLIDLAEPVDDEAVAAVRAAIVGRITNVAFADGPEHLREVVDALAPEHRALAVQIASVVMELLVERADSRVLLAGTANLARSDADLGSGLRPVLEALEEQVVLLRLIGERRDTATVDVRIGGENDIEPLRTTSLVATGYGPSDEALASLGVIGPTRMDYPGTMAAVTAVARYVGRILAGG